MQSIWSGNLAFGTILIPVRLYVASGDLHVPFHQVHAADSGRVRYKKVCEICGSELAAGEIRKSYEVAGQVITFTDEELDSLKPVASRSLRILGFCDLDEVPLAALDRSYYLGTEKGGKGGVGQSFALLRRALEKSGKAAIVSWVTHTSEQIGMMVPHEHGFLVKALLYADQVRPFAQVDIIEAEVDDDLVEKGVLLIDRMALRFRHESFRETYSSALKEIIEARALGKEVRIEPAAKKAETQSLEAELERLLA